LLVPVELGRVRATRRLVAAQTRDPGVHLGQRLLEWPDLADAAAGVGVAVPQLVAVQLALAGQGHALVDVDLHAVALLDLAPGLVGLGEEDAVVEREEW